MIRLLLMLYLWSALYGFAFIIEVVTEDYPRLNLARPGAEIVFQLKIPLSLVGEGETFVSEFSMVTDGNYSHDAWSRMGNLVRKSVDDEFILYESAKTGTVPMMTGFHQLKWLVRSSLRNQKVGIALEVSCSDGIVCNGYERLVAIPGRKKNTVTYQCASHSANLCNDHQACTVETCIEETGTCKFEKRPGVQDAKCKSCLRSTCKPACAKRTCGWDGCFGFCGPDCPAGQICSAGNCVPDDQRVGTCFHPVSLTEQAKLLNYKGRFTMTTSLDSAMDVIVPKCDSIRRDPEVIFRLDTLRDGGFIGLEVRAMSRLSNGGQNAVWIIEADHDKPVEQSCLESTVRPEIVWSCIVSFDPWYGSANWGSSATWMMRPGRTYYVAVERHDVGVVGTANQSKGNATIQVTLTPECTTFCEANQECGHSGCDGVNCGECPSGKTCVANKCVACTPSCPSDAKCGQSDGCGGTCLCVGLRGEGLDPEADEQEVLLLPHRVEPSHLVATKASQKRKKCNRLLPECTHVVNGVVRRGCKRKNDFCSVDCTCVPLRKELPDLTILPFFPYVDNIFIPVSSCALAEKCVGAPGSRTVVKFETKVFNQGTVDFRLPGPPASRNDLFEWASCHGHYHLKNFLQYKLLDLQGNLVVQGEKRSFCVMDMMQVYPRPDAPCRAKYDCNKQGLSVGWSDTYDDSLDCQFIDVTGVAPGVYIVRQCVNTNRLFEELSYENNCVEARISILPTRSPTTGSPTTPTLSPLERCNPGCPWHWLGDGICDVSCNNTACNFDGGDCSQVQCSPGCKDSWLGDNFCDRSCNNEACEFDHGDCEYQNNPN